MQDAPEQAGPEPPAPACGLVESLQPDAKQAQSIVTTIERMTALPKNPGPYTTALAVTASLPSRPLNTARAAAFCNGSTAYMRCGASIPSSSRPVASVRAVRAHSVSRDARSAGSDLSTGQSWKKVEKLVARAYR